MLVFENQEQLLLKNISDLEEELQVREYILETIIDNISYEFAKLKLATINDNLTEIRNVIIETEQCLNSMNKMFDIEIGFKKEIEEYIEFIQKEEKGKEK